MLDLDQLPSSQLLNEREVASILAVQQKTLTSWRHTKRVEIPFVKIGRSVKYRVSDLRTFVEANRQGSDFKEAA
jgi:hypothetical protein